MASRTDAITSSADVTLLSPGHTVTRKSGDAWDGEKVNKLQGIVSLTQEFEQDGDDVDGNGRESQSTRVEGLDQQLPELSCLGGQQRCMGDDGVGLIVLYKYLNCQIYIYNI